MKTEKALTQEVAVTRLQKLLAKNGIQTQKIDILHHHGHCIIKGSKFKLYCLYKRDYFNTFKRQFINFMIKFPKYSGKGESINEDALSIARKQNCSLIVFIHPEEIKCICPDVFKGISDNYDLKRIQDVLNPDRYKKNRMRGKNEFTCSVPIEMLREFELEELK